MNKRGNNEDSVYKDGDRWRGAVSLGYDANGKRVRTKVSGKTRAEVVEKLRELREQLTKGRRRRAVGGQAQNRLCREQHQGDAFRAPQGSGQGPGRRPRRPERGGPVQATTP